MHSDFTRPMSIVFDADDMDEFMTSPVDLQEEIIVELSIVEKERAARSKHNARLFKQGRLYFRLHNARRGERVELLAIQQRSGKAMIIGARGMRSVALCDLYPSV